MHTHICEHCRRAFESSIKATRFCSVGCATADPRLRRSGKPCPRCGGPRRIYASGIEDAYCRTCRNALSRISMRLIRGRQRVECELPKRG